MVVYDIPSARTYLRGTDKTVIRPLLKHEGRSNTTELLQESDHSIEAPDAGLKRLEIQGIVHQASRCGNE
jgi:hypothetical protein